MPRHATSSRADRSLHDFMIEDHKRLDELFGQLFDAMAVDAPDVHALWTELDHGLLAHMEAEEQFVLPAFARIDRQEALDLLLEHGQIRDQLLALGVAVDLHCIRLEQSRDFITILRAHADREDRLLYRWADARLDARLAEATRRHAGAR